MGTKKHVWAAALLLALSPMGNRLNAQNMEKKEIPQHLSDFPIGEPNTGFARYFIGQSYLAPLTSNGALNCPVSNVTFEPACRNNWHSHTGGQLLIAVGGRGYYQEKGKIIAYLRMFEKDTNTCQLGRIISLNRRQGFGTSLINETLQLLKQEKKYAKVYVEAQKYAIEFYEKLGFYAISDVFLEDGIEHVKMERFL